MRDSRSSVSIFPSVGLASIVSRIPFSKSFSKSCSRCFQPGFLLPLWFAQSGQTPTVRPANVSLCLSFLARCGLSFSPLPSSIEVEL